MILLKHEKQGLEELYTFAITNGNIDFAEQVKKYITMPDDQVIDTKKVLALYDEAEKLIEQYSHVVTIYRLLYERKYVHAANATMLLSQPLQTMYARIVIEACIENITEGETAELIVKTYLFGTKLQEVRMQYLETIATTNYIKTGQAIKAYLVIYGSLGKRFTKEQIEQLTANALKNGRKREVDFIISNLTVQ